jgi:hypothetical protein
MPFIRLSEMGIEKLIMVVGDRKDDWWATPS